MEFNFQGRHCPRKKIFFRENRGSGGGTTRLSLDRSTVRKVNLQPKYLKCNGIKDTCSLTNKQKTKKKKKKKKNIFTFRLLNKMSFQNKTLKCLPCLLVTLCHMTLFAIQQLVVNINANILFNKVFN